MKLLISIIAALWLTSVAAQPSPQKVVVWRLVPTNYQDKSFSQSEFQDVLDSSPPRAVVVKTGQNVSSILHENFNVSQSQNAAVYDQILAKLRELNGEPNLQNVAAHSRFVIPELPTASAPSTVSSKRRGPPALVLGLESNKYVWNNNEGVFKGSLGPKTPKASTAQMELQYFEMSAEDARTYLAPLSPNISGQSGPINAVLADGIDGLPSPDKVLKVDEAAAIRKAIANAGASAPRPVLVIFDDSIPNNDEFAVTKRFVIEVSKVIRQQYGLGDSPYIDGVQKLQKMLTADDSLFYPQQKIHSALIHHALDEFTALDPQGRISIVYIPMAATQLEVAPIFKELLYLNYLLRSAQSSLAENRTADPSQRSQAQQITETVVANNRDVFVSAHLTPLSAGQVTVATDAALIEALTVVLRYYSEASQRPHFLSFSWTVPNLQVRPYFEPAPYGWRLAAVGNGSNGHPVNVLNTHLQFAARSIDPKDFVAVANSTASAQHCITNSFEAPAGANVMGLAFPGNVTAAFCGTSFSTPRLAWLLAAREVVKGQTLPKNDTGALGVWIESKRALVLGLQNNFPDFLRRYDVHVDKLLGL